MTEYAILAAAAFFAGMLNTVAAAARSVRRSRGRCLRLLSG